YQALFPTTACSRRRLDLAGRRYTGRWVIRLRRKRREYRARVERAVWDADPNRRRSRAGKDRRRDARFLGYSVRSAADWRLALETATADRALVGAARRDCVRTRLSPGSGHSSRRAGSRLPTRRGPPVSQRVDARAAAAKAGAGHGLDRRWGLLWGNVA